MVEASMVRIWATSSTCATGTALNQCPATRQERSGAADARAADRCAQFLAAWRHARDHPRHHRKGARPNVRVWDERAAQPVIGSAEAVFAEAATVGMAPIEAAGFGQLLVPEADGGFGGDWGDLFAVLRRAGARLRAHLPVGEAIVGEVSRPDRGLRPRRAGGRRNRRRAGNDIDHVNTRQQFGKPLGKFQAVQQVLAIFATEAAAVNVAGAAAAAALDRAGGDAEAVLFRSPARNCAPTGRSGKRRRLASGAWRHRLHAGI